MVVSLMAITITVAGDSEPWIKENVEPGDTVWVYADLPNRTAPINWSAICD